MNQDQLDSLVSKTDELKKSVREAVIRAEKMKEDFDNAIELLRMARHFIPDDRKTAKAVDEFLKQFNQ